MARGLFKRASIYFCFYLLIECAPKVSFLFSRRSHFDWLHPYYFFKHWAFPQSSSKEVLPFETPPFLVHTHTHTHIYIYIQLWAQKNGIGLHCYWEHLREHFGNLVKAHENSMVTHRGQKKLSHPTPSPSTQ